MDRKKIQNLIYQSTRGNPLGNVSNETSKIEFSIEKIKREELLVKYGKEINAKKMTVKAIKDQ